jgi:DNA polymerase-3 subunit beta
LFEANNGTLKITGSDFKTFLTVLIPCGNDIDINFCLNAKEIEKTLKNINSVLSIEVIEKKILLSFDEISIELETQDVNEFPKAQNIEKPKKLALSREILNKISNKCTDFCSTDYMRPVMTGLNFNLSKNELICGSTDAHHLIKYSFDIKNKIEASFIISKNVISLIGKLIKSEARILFNETHIFFEFDNYKITSRLIEGKFPNFNAVIPEKHEHTAKFNTKQLINIVKIALNNAHSITKRVVFKFDKECSITASDEDYRKEFKSKINCISDFKDFYEIGFNGVLLLNVLDKINTDNVDFFYNSNCTGVKILPDNTKTNKDLYLLMPVML